MDSFIYYITKSNKWVGIILLLFICGLVSFAYYSLSHGSFFGRNKTKVETFEQCMDAKGSKVLESFPRRCTTADGKMFVEELNP